MVEAGPPVDVLVLVLVFSVVAEELVFCLAVEELAFTLVVEELVFFLVVEELVFSLVVEEVVFSLVFAVLVFPLLFLVPLFTCCLSVVMVPRCTWLEVFGSGFLSRFRHFDLSLRAQPVLDTPSPMSESGASTMSVNIESRSKSQSLTPHAWPTQPSKKLSASTNTRGLALLIEVALGLVVAYFRSRTQTWRIV